MKIRHIHILAILLTLFGLAVFLYKWQVTGLPLTAGQLAPAWNIETQITFEANGGPVKVRSFFPENSGSMSVLDKRYIAKGFGLSAQTVDKNREITLAKREASGLQVLHLRFTIHQKQNRDKATAAAPEKPVVRLVGTKLTAAQEVLETAKKQSADEGGLVSAVLKLLSSAAPSDSVKELLGKKLDLKSRANAAVGILALEQISARQINGLDLTSLRKDAQIIQWLEAYVDGAWINYSIETGNSELSDNALVWWRGPHSLVQVEGGEKLKRHISLIQIDERVLDRILTLGKNNQDELITFSLFGLPIATQEVYRVMMVVPIGIFILVVLRNIIGVRSLGTFMPVLIAIAFRETNLIWGLVLFSCIVGSGLLFRFYLEHLKLLLVPRLASVLIFVVLFMAVISVVTTKLGFERGISIALFPMVIMTMTIERVSILWDERGPAEALQQAIGALAIAALCYLVMTISAVEHLFFTFPELLLILLAATLLIGRYTGYRLLELKRFRVLAGDNADV